jgi:hypothetical protein
MLQIGLHLTPQLSGLLIAPIALGVLTVKPLALTILRWCGYKKLLLINTCLITLSLASSSSPPNLLFIIVDDLSARIQGHYEQPGLTPLTPNLVRLQELGVTFTRAYTRVTVCSPSRTALLTGLRPETTRLWTIGPYWRNRQITPRWGSLSLYQRLLRTQTITQQVQERFGTQGRPRVDCLNGEAGM